MCIQVCFSLSKKKTKKEGVLWVCVYTCIYVYLVKKAFLNGMAWHGHVDHESYLQKLPNIRRTNQMRDGDIEMANFGDFRYLLIVGEICFKWK